MGFLSCVLIFKIQWISLSLHKPSLDTKIIKTTKACKFKFVPLQIRWAALKPSYNCKNLKKYIMLSCSFLLRTEHIVIRPPRLARGKRCGSASPTRFPTPVWTIRSARCRSRMLNSLYCSHANACFQKSSILPRTANSLCCRQTWWVPLDNWCSPNLRHIKQPSTSSKYLMAVIPNLVCLNIKVKFIMWHLGILYCHKKSNYEEKNCTRKKCDMLLKIFFILWCFKFF